jgi:abhydrolase domain-containing protein 4
MVRYRVRHLILADPWGFPEKPSNVYEKYQVPLWVRAVATAVRPLNPLWAVRAAGPAGKWLVGKTRPDLARKYVGHVPDADAVIPEYIYQCNSQTPRLTPIITNFIYLLGYPTADY